MFDVLDFVVDVDELGSTRLGRFGLRHLDLQGYSMFDDNLSILLYSIQQHPHLSPSSHLSTMSSSPSRSSTFSWQTTEFLPPHHYPPSTSHPTHLGSRSADATMSREGRRKQALIILNQPITRHDTLERLWSSCQCHSHICPINLLNILITTLQSKHDIGDIKLCADGGANRLHDHLFHRALIRKFPSGHRSSRSPNTRSNGFDAIANSSTINMTHNDDDVERQSSYYIEKEMFEERRWLPDVIKGDLDSLRDDVKEYYESMVRAASFLNAFQYITSSRNTQNRGSGSNKIKMNTQRI